MTRLSVTMCGQLHLQRTRVYLNGADHTRAKGTTSLCVAWTSRVKGTHYL
jgi:hypothetical protein